jgi:hypothetical protein
MYCLSHKEEIKVLGMNLAPILHDFSTFLAHRSHVDGVVFGVSRASQKAPTIISERYIARALLITRTLVRVANTVSIVTTILFV